MRPPYDRYERIMKQRPLSLVVTNSKFDIHSNGPDHLINYVLVWTMTTCERWSSGYDVDLSRPHHIQIGGGPIPRWPPQGPVLSLGELFFKM